SPPGERGKGKVMSSFAPKLLLKKVPEEVGSNTFLKKSPEERTRNISVLLVASVSAAVHVALGVLMAPLFAIAFLAAKTPSNPVLFGDRKSTRLNSSHLVISYAVFCLKKKKYFT